MDFEFDYSGFRFPLGINDYNKNFDKYLPDGLFDCVVKLLPKCSRYEVKFLLYIYLIEPFGGIVRMYSDEVYNLFGRKKYKNSINKLCYSLESGKYLTRHRYKNEKYPFGYSLKKEFLNDLTSVGFNIFETIRPDKLKKKYNLQPIKPKLYNTNKNYYPEVIRRAIQKNKYCYIDYNSYLEFIHKVVDDIKFCIGENIGGLNNEHLRLLKDIWRTNLFLKRQGYRYSDGRFLSYYNVSNTGRIFGNLTGMNRKLKSSVFPREKFYNYDLSKSQMRILKSYAENIYNIDCHAIDDYNNGTDGKTPEYYANKIGIDVKHWKKILFAMVFGSKITHGYSTIRSYITSVIDDYNINFNTDYDVMEKGVIKLTRKGYIERCIKMIIDETIELRKVFDTWSKCLINDYEKLPIESNNRFKFRYIKNDVDLPYRIDGYFDEVDKHGKQIPRMGKNKKLSRKTMRGLSAHLLQGRENLFIMTLTDVITTNGNTVCENDFDGLVTTKPIAKDEIEKAKLLCSEKMNGKIDYSFMNFEEKSIGEIY